MLTKFFVSRWLQRLSTHSRVQRVYYYRDTSLFWLKRKATKSVTHVKIERNQLPTVSLRLSFSHSRRIRLNSLKSALVSDEVGSWIAEDITSQRRNNESRDLERNNEGESRVPRWQRKNAKERAREKKRGELEFFPSGKARDFKEKRGEK